MKPTYQEKNLPYYILGGSSIMQYFIYFISCTMVKILV